MVSNQTDDRAATESVSDLTFPVPRDVRNVEREAHAVEREARALEAEVRGWLPPVHLHLRDLLFATERDVILCQILLDEHREHWDHRELVEKAKKQLEGVADEVRASVEQSQRDRTSGASGADRKGSPGKQ